MIKLFVGQKGSGKTLQMIKDSQWFFNRGYKVYSNFPCWGYYKEKGIKNVFKSPKRVKADFIYSEELEEKIKTTFESKIPTLFMIDEAPVMYHSREWKNFDLDLIYAINQSRKSNVHLFMSAQIYNALDKQMRETANYVYLCEKKFFKPIRIFLVLVLDPLYFKEETKSIFLKNYIKKRKIFSSKRLSKYYKFYDTGHVILPMRFAEKFPNLFPDPRRLSIPEIIMNSMSHVDREPPI